MDNKKKVLIVDDEEDFLRITKLNLEATGRFEVMALSHPRSIMTQLHDFRPDVIMLDLLMPGMGGIEICQMLNRDPLGQKVPIIILSALDKDSDKLIAYKYGVVDYLVKPIEKDGIVTSLDRALKFK